MTISKLILHHFPMTRSTRVKWALHETVGEAFEVREVDLYAGAHRRPEFLELNPNHAVPVLEIAWTSGERLIMIESAAMVAFLGDAYPEAGVAPAPGASRARADYLQMLHFGGSWMDMMLWQIRVQEHLLPEDERDAKTIARYREKLQSEVEPQLKRRLETAPFICGEAFTLADCVVGHNVGWARAYGLCSDRVFKAYLARLAERPARAAAYSDAARFSLATPAGNRPDK